MQLPIFRKGGPSETRPFNGYPSENNRLEGFRVGYYRFCKKVMFRF